jgi:hypothetical protein
VGSIFAESDFIAGIANPADTPEWLADARHLKLGEDFVALRIQV